MSRLVLGISDDYVSNVALFADGRPVFAAANERFSRRKGDAGFPTLAFQAALTHAGVGPEDLDQVVFANRTHFVYRLLHSRFKDYAHDFLNVKQKLYLRYHDLVHASEGFASMVELFNGLLARRDSRAPISFCDHHTCHAGSGVATSGFESCLAITVDNLGDGSSAGVFSYRDGQIKRLRTSSASRSPGQFYGEITQILGFNPLRHAGKVTGLAARGDPAAAYGIVSELFGVSEDGRDFWMMPSFRRWAGRGPYFRLGVFSPEDVAAATQKRLEDAVLKYVDTALRETGHRRVVLAGGVFANVKLNLVIHQHPLVDEVHVHPAMSDEGLAFGAAACELMSRGELVRGPLADAFLGPDHEASEIRQALSGGALPHLSPARLPETLACLLDKGHVVARFDGRLEYGPRALGNRTILYRPDDPSVNDWLNHKLRRTEFMPFAPVTLAEDTERCYRHTEGARETARFMTMAFECQPEMADTCPGVVHVDNTARPQLVHRHESPAYYDIVKAWKERTGLPCLINTSFNMHEEPIVCTPQDAVTAFKDAGLDFLVIGGSVAWNPARPDLREILEDASTWRE